MVPLVGWRPCPAHLRYIDILEQVLNNNAGLSSLYHYRSSVLKALEACTKHPYQSRFAAAFLGVIQEMPGAVLPTYPREVRWPTRPRASGGRPPMADPPCTAPLL